MEKVKELSEMKKKPGGREGAVGIVGAIADKCYESAEPFLIAALPLVLELCADKMKFVGELAQKVVKKIIDELDLHGKNNELIKGRDHQRSLSRGTVAACPA